MPEIDISAPIQTAVPDEVLLASAERARTALLEITPASTIGAPAGHIVEGERVLSLLFECTLAGYPGWYWTVSLARTSENAEASVLETELMPGDRAVLAPDWIPWSERLAEYQASQEAARAAGLAEGDDDTDDGDSDDGDGDDIDDDTDDDDDIDETDDLDDLEEGDLDGVDIDALHDALGDALSDEPEFESEDITGVELATLELEDDESEDAETTAGSGHPDQPAEAAGEHGLEQD